jgi:hypothetical protein
VLCATVFIVSYRSATGHESPGEVDDATKQLVYREAFSYRRNVPRGLTLVEVMDYECGPCRSQQGELERLLTSAPELNLSVALAINPTHRYSATLRKIGYYANQQGRFRDFHKKLLATAKLDEKAVSELAREIPDTGPIPDYVQRVSSTPTYFFWSPSGVSPTLHSVRQVRLYLDTLTSGAK